MKLSKFAITLLTFSLFSSIFFFGFYILTGRYYAGAESDNSYISYMMIVDLIPLFYFLKFISVSRSQKNVWPIILTLIGFVIFYGVGVGVNDINFKSLLAFSIPSAMTGIIIAKSGQGVNFAKLLEPIMLFITMTGVASMGHLLSVSVIRDIQEEGIGASSLSYHCGFAFALNLFFLLFGEEMPERFKYTKTILYKYFSVVLLIVQFAVGLSSGGRGGFVLLIVSALVLLVIRLIRHNTSPIKITFTLLLVSFAIIIAYKYMPQNINEAMSRGSERTFSYISKGEIDTSETSNRDIVYAECLNSISENPIFGYGLLMKGTPFYGDRPHNIILEILLQGGFLYLFAFLIFLIFLFKKLRLLVKYSNALFMIPIILYPFVMLMFSASYIGTDLFWFVLSYILCCRIPMRRIHLKPLVE